MKFAKPCEHVHILWAVAANVKKEAARAGWRSSSRHQHRGLVTHDIAAVIVLSDLVEAMSLACARARAERIANV